MKEIELTQDRSTIVDDSSFEYLSKYKWCYSSGMASRREMILDKGKIKYTTILMHRFILNPLDGSVVKHINGNKLDNRQSNLTTITKAQSNLGAKPYKNKLSKHKGVNRDISDLGTGNHWLSNITVNGKNIHLGRFHTEEQAARAYNTASKLYHGGYGYQNKLDGY